MGRRTPAPGSIALALTLVSLAAPAAARQQPGTVLAEQKISQFDGNFSGTLSDVDKFGRSIAALGDLNGDCIGDVAVGANEDDDGGTNRGAVWLLAMNRDGTAFGQQKISDLEGGFTGVLRNGDEFGRSVAAPGDLDGDGVEDLLVGARGDEDGGTNRGAVWVLFLNVDGTVKGHQKISSTTGGFGGALANGDSFGCAVATIGDLDGDGVVDAAVGAFQDDNGGLDRGSVWILFLNSDGTVKAHQEINEAAGGFTGVLDDGDNFGFSVASLGDLDGDGNHELAVGADRDDDGGTSRGAVWVLFLNADGTVKAHQKISASTGIVLTNFDRFGTAVAGLGDIDGNGVGDLCVGAIDDDDGGINMGALWVFFLESDGTLTQPVGFQKISSIEGGLRRPGRPQRPVRDGAGTPGGPGPRRLRRPDGRSTARRRRRPPTAAPRGCCLCTRIGWSAWRSATAPGSTRSCSRHRGRRRSGSTGPPRWTARASSLASSTTWGAWGSTQGVFDRAGELLLDLSSPVLFMQARLHMGGTVTFTHVVPPDPQFCGWSGTCQALIGGGPGPVFSNALDFVIGG